ncbi:ribonuclease E inhibitor RraB [Burkholderia stagnalis]|uniref:ribonuclease E inhibitor RraB n=1 Tax=Burkholderia stagnalis TaxID=1503054 RepID=UPI000A6D6A03|nr:ribonuclease E inhibitor RraB [Burkholderia stagnalis]
MKAEDFEFEWLDQIDGERAKALVLPEEYTDMKNSSAALELATVVSLLEQSKAQGDIPDRLRRIRHVTYFDSEKAADRLTKKLIANGYIDVNVMKVIGVPLWRIDFFHIGNATLPHMAHWMCIVRKMVAKAGGAYDGCEFPCMASHVADESLLPERDGPIWSLVTMVPRDQSANDSEPNAPQSLVA